MDLEIREEPIGSLSEHAQMPVAYLVDKILDVSVSDGGLGGIILQERGVDAPYVKDYDAIKGEGPTRWPKRFDVTNWGLIAVHASGERVGGAVVAFKTPNLEMLGGGGGALGYSHQTGCTALRDWLIPISRRSRMGACARVHTDPNRDAKRQPSGLLFLRKNGLRTGEHQSFRVSGATRRGPNSLASGPVNGETR